MQHMFRMCDVEVYTGLILFVKISKQFFLPLADFPPGIMGISFILTIPFATWITLYLNVRFWTR